MAEQKIPEKMRGTQILQYSDDAKEFSKNIKINEVPVPKPTNDQVLIKVHAASINPIDWKVATGFLSLIFSPPLNAGFDFAGHVVSVGSSCKRIKVGDAVYGMNSFKIMGSFAEYVAVPETNVAIKPKSLTFAEAASIPLVGLTSYQSLVDNCKLAKDKKVLILGGAGGTGSIGIQIAKILGASQIVTTASEKNFDFVRSMGADQVIDYKNNNWAEELKGKDFDIVYDTVGGYEYWRGAMGVLSSKGSFATITGDSHGKLSVLKLLGSSFSLASRKFWSFFPYPNYDVVRCDGTRSDQLNLFTKWIEEGKLKPTVEKVFPFEEVVQFYEKSAAGRTVGKLTLAVTPQADKKE